MGTRSRIGYETPDGSIESVYCHWDGYPSHNGTILLENYNGLDLVKALVALGDISSLGKSIEKPAGHTFDTPVDGYTVFYNRDRGETDVGSQSATNRKDYVALAKKCGGEYAYIFTKNGKWAYVDLHGTGERWLALTPKACKEKA
jgi:hypothetical protein